MALKKRGKFRYGESRADIRDEVTRFSALNGYVAHHFEDATCACGATTFRLLVDEQEGVAIRRCVVCSGEHVMGDGAQFLADATPEACACPCGKEEFEISVGVSLYEGSRDVRWMYLGCRCPSCGLTAVYGDWKNEAGDYGEFLRLV